MGFGLAQFLVMDMMDITKRQTVIAGAQNPKFEKFLTEKVKNIRSLQNVIEISNIFAKSQSFTP